MMMYRYKRGASGREGVAMVYAIFGAMMAAGMVSVMFATASSAVQQVELRKDEVRARYLAEGAADVARKAVSDAVANWATPPEGGSLMVGNTEVPYTIERVGATRSKVDASGIQTLIDAYEITAIADVDGRQEIVSRLVTTESTPVFQFAVFYTNDLEVLPGPSMTLGGRVHSNGDMYLGCGNTLTMDTNYVHAIGQMYRSRKDGGLAGGTVNIREWVNNPYDASEPSNFQAMLSQAQFSGLGVGSDSGYDSAFTEGFDFDGDGFLDGPDDWLPFAAGALDRWNEPDGYTGGSGHTVMTGDHDLMEASAPDIGSIAMFEESDAGDYSLNDNTGEYEFVGAGLGTFGKGYFHDNAGLSIIINQDSTDFQVFGPDGAEFNSGGESYRQLLIDSGAVDIDGIADMRQSDSSGTDTVVLEVDMGLLGAAGLFPDNGLLYAAHYGMDVGTEARGILLANGSELADRLTVACEGSIYLQGDYNTVNKRGASVIGDGVNLLSNSWDGSKTPGSLPSASETTYNCAFITGNYESETGRYNGGLENLPRFHERWSNVNCNITGSFVNPWDSEYATGDWVYGSDRYKAPRRNWNYDTDFNQVGSLPPFTPMVVNSRQIVSW
ncbi:MAG: hypothetical protein ACI87O_001239 [Planctomycetota bacterium]|jgi:hypothetical protein